jgi:hypothetical protein
MRFLRSHRGDGRQQRMNRSPIRGDRIGLAVALHHAPSQLARHVGENARSQRAGEMRRQA